MYVRTYMYRKPTYQVKQEPPVVAPAFPPAPPPPSAPLLQPSKRARVDAGDDVKLSISQLTRTVSDLASVVASTSGAHASSSSGSASRPFAIGVGGVLLVEVSVSVADCRLLVDGLNRAHASAMSMTRLCVQHGRSFQEETVVISSARSAVVNLLESRGVEM